MNAIRHVILDQRLSCAAQMLTGYKLAEAHGAVLHFTGTWGRKPTRKHPGMSSTCMPGGRCHHDLAVLRREGAIDIADDTPCWTPDGTACRWCGGARGTAQMAFPDEYPVPRMRTVPAVQGVLW